MTAASSWQDVLKSPLEGNHIVQVYSETAFLVDAVGAFVGHGLDNGEGIVIVATPSHREAFIKHLMEKKYDIDRSLQDERLIMLDAEELLSRFMQAKGPNEKLFNTLVGEVLEKARPSTDRPLRVYGEMVNILYQQGNVTAAIELEEFWNRLGQRLPFILFCAYEMDPLNVDVYDNKTLQHICRTHSHFIPARNYEKLATATDRAVEETLGRSLAGTLRALDSSSDVSSAKMPFAQSHLLWLHQSMPGVGDKVLQLARHYYRSTGSSALKQIRL